MSDDNEPMLIVCLPATTERGPAAAATVPCFICKCEVWVAPATIALLKQHPTRAFTFCVECARELELRRIAMGCKPAALAVTAKQELELFTHTGVTATEAWIQLGISPERIKRIK